MDIDISQFYDVFFEESFEGLDAMESELLGLDIGSADSETVNSLFRAAHSIKGGAGTFGFTFIAEFTHVMETILNEMRNGQRDVTAESTNLLLQAVDVLRGMLRGVQKKEATDDKHIAAMHRRLEIMLAGENVEAQANDDSDLGSEEQIKLASSMGWLIYFRPNAHFFQTGNDPVRMIRELASLGELSSELIDDKLPPFSDFEPEDSYLAWQFTLTGDIAKDDVVDIFEWVDDYCDLTIDPIMTAESAEIEESVLDYAQDDKEQISTPIENKQKSEITASPTVKPIEEEAPIDNENLKVTIAPSASSIRVGIDKIDSLINLVSELVITQSMLSRIGDNFTPSMLPNLIDGLAQLERNSREMQEGVTRIRMLPISFVFNRFSRLVHDISEKMGKKVKLELIGEQTELDKSVIEKIGDPIVHLVRNSLDHGLEVPEQRLAAGKTKTGLLQLKAFHQGGNIIIEVHDDGAGLNEDDILAKAIEKGLIDATDILSTDQIHNLIFLPGFSTADVVSDVSGRGVGMDVVNKNIASLGGSVEVESKQGEGTVFSIRLPLTLAIMDGQTIRVADENYILPLISIIETIEIKNTDIKQITGKGELYTLRNEYIPIIRLYEVFNLKPHTTELEQGLVVIVEGEGKKAGLFIDDLLGQQQVVIKSLEDNYRKVIGLSGATILGDGTVALIIDVSGLMALYQEPSLAVLTRNEQVA